jgi:transposase-like protein
VDGGEALSDCERGAKPKGIHGPIARRHQVSEGLIYRWREKFFDGGKAALTFEGRSGSGGEKAALERQVEELKPSWTEVEASRVAEGLTVKAAIEILGSRSSYYRQVRGMTDYQVHPRRTASTQNAEVLREVALKRVEAGHRRVRA